MICKKNPSPKKEMVTNIFYSFILQGALFLRTV